MPGGYKLCPWSKCPGGTCPGGGGGYVLEPWHCSPLAVAALGHIVSPERVNYGSLKPL